VLIDEEIPAAAVSVSASSEYGADQSAKHLIDSSGLKNGLHDNRGGAESMWHTVEKPGSKPPADGLAPSPAWVRFDFTQPQKFDAIRIWNHNQANLIDRGFRKTRIYGSTDSVKWFPLTSPEAIEVPRSSGASGAEAVTITNAAAASPVKSVIIAAEAVGGNYGGDCFGLSEVRFIIQREVAEADLPVPTGMVCAALPYSPYRPDGSPGREIAVSLRGGKLYRAVTLEVECAGAKERTTVPASPRGADHFTVLLPAGISVTNEYEAIVNLQSERCAFKQTVAVPPCVP